MSGIRASMELSLTFDEGKLRAEMSALAKVPGGERKALARAINRALNGTRTDITADLRGRTVLKAGTIRKGIFVRSAGWRSHTQVGGSVNVSTARLPLSEYKVSPMRQTAQKGRLPARYRPLSYRLAPSGKTFDNTAQQQGRSKLFMVRHWRSGKLEVFSRIGSERERIAIETGPSLQAFYGNSGRQQDILAKAAARFRKELAHQTSHLAGGGK